MPPSVKPPPRKHGTGTSQPKKNKPASKVQIAFLFIAMLLIIAGSAYWFYGRGEQPGDAMDALAQQNIEITADGFLKEVQAGNLANIHLFIVAGTNAGTQNKDGSSALITAVTGGNKDVIAMILSALPASAAEASRVLNMQDKDGRTALIAAVERNDETLMNQLIALGADTAIFNHAQETPLIIAIKHHYDGLVPPLIAADSKQHQNSLALDNPDATGDTPLIYAIREQNEKLVKILLDAKVDPLSGDLAGTTPLMATAEVGNTSLAKLFMNAGAKPDSADKAGNTPLSIALRHNHPDFIKFLITNGANPDFHTTGPVPLQIAIDHEPFDSGLIVYMLTHSKAMGDFASPLLFKAVDHKDAAIVSLLLDEGLSAKAIDARGETLLYHAIESGDENTALSLIDKGAPLTETGIPGITPLERAVEHNETKVVEKLLSKGITPNQKTSEGYTFAEMAIYRGYPEILEALLKSDARVEKNFGILWSVRDGGGKAVPILLAYGGNANVMNETGDSALWLAASAGEVEAVKALLAAHAGLDYPNKGQGMTPLAIASHTGQLPVVKILLDAGAKLESKDNFGMTPLAHAAYMGKPDVVEYLMSKGADVHATDNQGRAVFELAQLATATDTRDKVLSLLQRQR